MAWSSSSANGRSAMRTSVRTPILRSASSRGMWISCDGETCSPEAVSLSSVWPCEAETRLRSETARPASPSPLPSRSGSVADAGEDHVRERFNRGLDHQPLAEHVKGVDALLLEIQAGERVLELHLLRLELRVLALELHLGRLEILRAFENAPLQTLVERPDFLLRLLAVGDVADKAREDRLTGHLDSSDGELDRKLTAVRSHRHQLEPLPEDGAFICGEIVGETAVVRIAQRGRNDEVGHLHSDDVFPRIAEGLLRCRVELENVPLVVDRDDAIERRLEHGALSGLASRRPLLPSLQKASAEIDQKRAHRAASGRYRLSALSTSRRSSCGE